MITKEEKEQIFNIISPKFNSIYISDCYDEEQNYDMCSEDKYDDMLNQVGADDMDYGASKIVFWFSELKDYVVKIPILGRFDEWEEDYVDYSNAINEDIGVRGYPDNYCELEASIYNFAWQNYNNIAQCFAPTYYIGTTRNGIRLYVSEKVSKTLNHTRTKSVSENSTKKAQMLIDTYGRHPGGLSEYAISVLYESYTEKIVHDLILFIYNFGIDDLHGNNLGFLQDRLVLIDYCGFYD